MNLEPALSPTTNPYSAKEGLLFVKHFSLFLSPEARTVLVAAGEKLGLILPTAETVSPVSFQSAT
jgi:hypothetical protein